MKEITKDQEKKLYKLLRLLFFALSILLFVVVENYVVVQVFRRGQVAVQDAYGVVCEQTTDGKYYLSKADLANVYNGTGRTIEDLVVTVRYVTEGGASNVCYEMEAGDFEPYIKDGEFNAYQLNFQVEPKADLFTDAKIMWLEFDVESYRLATTTFDYLMIGVFAVGCISMAMFAYSNKVCKAMNEGEATSVAVIGEESSQTVEEKNEAPVEEACVASEEEIEEFLNEIEDSDILL